MKAEVLRVIDGDTIEVLVGKTVETVRLIGVDTPETKHPSKPVQHFGKEAESYTRSQLDGRTIHLESDAQTRDTYGRMLAYVWLDAPTSISSREVREKQFNAQLLIKGYARLLTVPPNVKYANGYFVDYQKEAREKQAGLWRAPPSTTVKVTTTTVRAVTTTLPPTGEFAGSAKSDVYHYPSCSYVERINPENLIRFGSVEDAQAQGYRACKICQPPK
jgi:micrococcal nuclease